MTVPADRVAESVLATFDRLAPKSKPRQYADGSKEWVPLSGIVLSKDADTRYTCVSLGTGMRCLPGFKVPLANGRCLHDWHAEIVSIRAFNIFLIDECASIASDPALKSEWIRRRTAEELSVDSNQPFAIKDDVHIDMYCSEAPCGDASMELIMKSQTDAAPWPLEARCGSDPSTLEGRGHFSVLGVVRRKPGRRDAPETKSKSCSDKLALKQMTSLLSSITSLLLHPGKAYLRNLVLPFSRYHYGAIERAFGASGRMSLLTSPSNDQLPSGGYTFRPFNVQTTSKLFRFSRGDDGFGQSPTGSNITSVWTSKHNEVLIGGTIQGHKQFSVRGSSVICRAQIWEAALAVARALAGPELVEILGQIEYFAVKRHARLRQRKAVKDHCIATGLQGWLPNEGDDSFSISPGNSGVIVTQKS